MFMEVVIGRASLVITSREAALEKGKEEWSKNQKRRKEAVVVCYGVLV